MRYLSSENRVKNDEVFGSETSGNDFVYLSCLEFRENDLHSFLEQKLMLAMIFSLTACNADQLAFLKKSVDINALGRCITTVL